MSRANPMPPEQRRAAIIEAARPLLFEFGPDFTTRQVAEAAGVAEGTIFRVFASMGELQEAIIDDVMDAHAAQAALHDIASETDLDARVARIIEVVQGYVRETHVLFAVAARAHTQPDATNCRRARFAAVGQAMTATIADLLAPEAERLAIDPMDAAVLLRAAAVASEHPLLGIEHPKDPTQLAKLFLHGVLKEN